MNYQEMSDFEISRAVGDLLGVEWANLDENYNPLCIWPNDNFRKGDDGLFVFNPCNSWADAGLIAEENFISFDQHYNGSHAKVWGYSDKGLHEIYVLRRYLKKGICIVFLMMKGGE